ncbi:MAG TPA: TonB-dependent receptor [Gemmatimonadaceae bacterium]|nr:TonB-dependent receptor [Gemmatimonadaceae bacterium]
MTASRVLFRFGGIALLAGALSPAMAAGQAGSDSSRADSARTLKPVTVTESRAPGVVGGASAVVMKPEALRSSPAPMLEQALRESPFVHVRQNSRGEMELSVRGSDSRQAAVFMDGVPLTLGWDHRTDPSMIPMTGAQNVTIVRGLGSLLNGPNTLGGSIEITHDNGFGRLGPGRIWGGAGVDENAATVATLGGGRDLATVMGGALSLRAGVARRQREGFALPNGAADPTASDGLRTNSDFREIDAFTSLRWDTRNGRGVGLMFSGFNAERGVPPEENISQPRLWRYPYHTRSVAALSAKSGLFDTPFGFGTLDAGIGYNSGRHKIQSFSDRTYRTVDGEELGDERTLTARALATHSLPLDAILKAALTAADIHYEETLSPAAGAKYRQVMASGAAEIEVPAGTRTQLSGGLAYDRTTTPETGGRTPGQEPFDAIGWRAGVSHDASGALRLHASASRRSRFPALRELYSGALNRFRPNPDLKPETLLGVEAGMTLDRSFGPIPDATFQVTGFRHHLEDAVVRITLQNPTRFMRINRDRMESVGVELLAGFVFGEDAQRSFSLTGDATIQKIEVVNEATGEERHAENNPELRGMLELGVPLPYRVRAFTNARYTGRQYCLNADSGNEDAMAAQAETDLALERRFNVSGRGLIRSLRALVSMDNVANAAVYDSCGLPQPGRTLRVMFTFQ